MARKAEPGISYYQMIVGHVLNAKIRLLINECGVNGYWIWSCLLDRIYGDKGYYFDVSNREELELFASDVCRMRVSQVDEVIRGCVRRDLFNKVVFDSFAILTSDRIQLNYLEATSERRRKGTVIHLIKEYLVITPGEEEKNLLVYSVKEGLIILPRNNPQKKREYKRRKEKSAVAPEESPPHPPPELFSEPKKVLFIDSEFFDKKIFAATLENSEFSDANADYYYQRALCWSNSKRAKMVDWMAAIAGWMMEDKVKGKFISKDFKPSENGAHWQKQGVSTVGREINFDAP